MLTVKNINIKTTIVRFTHAFDRLRLLFSLLMCARARCAMLFAGRPHKRPKNVCHKTAPSSEKWNELMQTSCVIFENFAVNTNVKPHVHSKIINTAPLRSVFLINFWEICKFSLKMPKVGGVKKSKSFRYNVNRKRVDKKIRGDGHVKE